MLTVAGRPHSTREFCDRRRIDVSRTGKIDPELLADAARAGRKQHDPVSQANRLTHIVRHQETAWPELRNERFQQRAVQALRPVLKDQIEWTRHLAHEERPDLAAQFIRDHASTTGREAS